MRQRFATGFADRAEIPRIGQPGLAKGVGQRSDHQDDRTDRQDHARDMQEDRQDFYEDNRWGYGWGAGGAKA